MVNLGDVTKVNGSMAPEVHLITYGAPCQDLSVAGKRAGMKHESMGDDETTRSGLFFESIRIVKEMRNESYRKLCASGADVDRRLVKPRFTIYENVTGAFSSNNGEDFRAVLEETVKVADENAVIPGLAKGQKWTPCGCIMGDGYSVAWRTHDAQYWGVPQRRKRICVLADYGGESAPDILFELVGKTDNSETYEAITDFGAEPRPEVQSVSKSLSGDITESRKEGQGVTTDTERSADKASGVVSKGNGECFLTDEKHISLSTGGGQAGQGYPCVLQNNTAEPILLESNQNHATIQTDGVSTTLPASMGMGGGYVPMITDKAISFQERAGKPGGCKGILIQNERTGALSTLNN